MRITSFEWDDRNTSHIARHGITTDEAEEACSGNPLILRSRLKRYYVLGQADSGRYLTIIAQFKFGGIVRVISARDMDETERRRYLRR